MKILFLNNADVEGGSGRAATRLLKALRDAAIDASLLVQRKFTDSPRITGPASPFDKAVGFARPSIEQLIFGIAPRKTNGPFSPSFLPDRLPGKVAEIAPDIIHLHWVANMMRLETLRRFKTPLVWTLHDSWPFTGGCYVPFDCSRYRESCGRCPVLGSAKENDLSHRVWRRKERAWQGLDLTLVAPSRWMAECARASSLFHASRIEVIPNAIDTERFKPLDKRTAREFLGLPQDRRLILFGAKLATSDRNKGFHLLREALQELAEATEKESVELVIFGSSEPEQSPELGFKAHYLGWLGDDISLALLYAAADVFVFPSIQESLGYTVMEAMACGTPCVAFHQGGVTDLIDHRQNGYLAKPFETADLARGIAWILADAQRREDLACQGRQKMLREFALEKVAARHVALYREILQGDVRGMISGVVGEGVIR
jgi:glycosyltransferase involved in cell wall biosynthesis